MNTYETPLPDEDDILEELSDQGWDLSSSMLVFVGEMAKGLQVKSLSNDLFQA